MSRRGSFGSRVFRSPLNPGWTAGQGMRSAGQLGLSAMPTMSKLGDQAVDQLAGSVISPVGEQLGSMAGGQLGNAMGSLGSALGGLATEGGLTGVAAGLSAIPGIGPALGGALESVSPLISGAAGIGSKALGMPLEFAGNAMGKVGAEAMADLGGKIGKAAAPAAMKMGGRLAMAAPSSALLGTGSLLSGGGEPGDAALMQGAMFGSMPKLGDFNPEKVPAPGDGLKPLGEPWAEEWADPIKPTIPMSASSMEFSSERAVPDVNPILPDMMEPGLKKSSVSSTHSTAKPTGWIPPPSDPDTDKDPLVDVDMDMDGAVIGRDPADKAEIDPLTGRRVYKPKWFDYPAPADRRGR